MNYAEFKERERKVIAWHKLWSEFSRIAIGAIRNYLLRERLAKLRERYAMNNKGTGVSDAH